MAMTRIGIVADTREATSGIPGLLRKGGIAVEMKRLDVGDYVIAQYAVERKTARDFITSLYTGRLFDQADRIAKSYKNFLLVVEGETQETLAGLKNPRVYWGTILALALNLDFKIFFTFDQEQTADLLYVLAKRVYRRRTATKPLLARKPRMGTTSDWQLAIVEGLPTIGPKLAERLLASLGSVRNIFRASRLELALKGRIGHARAKQIEELLDARYRRDISEQARLG